MLQDSTDSMHFFLVTILIKSDLIPFFPSMSRAVDLTWTRHTGDFILQRLDLKAKTSKYNPGTIEHK